MMKNLYYLTILLHYLYIYDKIRYLKHHYVYPYTNKGQYCLTNCYAIEKASRIVELVKINQIIKTKSLVIDDKLGYFMTIL